MPFILYATLVHSTLGTLNTNDSLIYTILIKVQNLDKQP